MSETVNWADLMKQAEDATKIMPDGEYPAAVESAEVVTASTGSKMIKIKFKVNNGPYTGRTQFTNLVLSTNSGFALDMFFKRLAGLGVTAEVLASGPSLEQIAASVVDRQCTIVVGHKPYQGVDRNEVGMIKPAGAGVLQGAVVIGAALGTPSVGAASAVPSGVPSMTPTASPAIGAAQTVLDGPPAPAF